MTGRGQPGNFYELWMCRGAENHAEVREDMVLRAEYLEIRACCIQ